LPGVKAFFIGDINMNGVIHSGEFSKEICTIIYRNSGMG